MIDLKKFYKKGYIVIENILSDGEIKLLKEKLNVVKDIQHKEFSKDNLKNIGELNMVRCPLFYDSYFLNLITKSQVIDICEKILGKYFILSLQNSIIIPPNQPHHQSFYHRDIIHQDFTSSQPLGINIYYCLDKYTPQNGGTIFLEKSHLSPKFNPELKEICPIVNPGSIILFDSMLYHKAGINKTNNFRYGINNMFTLPFLKQQFDFSYFLKGKYSQDPYLKRVLGYQTQEFKSVKDFRNFRLKKINDELG